MQPKIKLSSSFYIAAKLITSLQSVKRKMGWLPYAAMNAEGSKLRYAINGMTNRALLEFGSSYISYVFYFDNPNNALYSRNLLAFISILAFLNEEYDIKLAGIYRYIIYALTKSTATRDIANDINTEMLKDQVKVLNSINASLAKELVNYRAKQRELNYNMDIYRKFAKEVLSAEKSGNSTAVPGFIEVDAETIKQVQKLLAKG